MESLARCQVIFLPGQEDQEPATEATHCQPFFLESAKKNFLETLYVTEKISAKFLDKEIIGCLTGGFDSEFQGHGYALNIRQPNMLSE